MGFLGGLDWTSGDRDYESEAKKIAAKLAFNVPCENINSYAYLRVIAALLVETSTISYADFGVPLVDGGLPAVILAEHLVIVSIYKKVAEDVRREWSDYLK